VAPEVLASSRALGVTVLQVDPFDPETQSKNKGQTDVHTLFASQPQPSLSEPLNKGEFLLFRVGDCISMHNIHGALYDALRLVKDF
jgi:hypothetical protein